MEKTNLASSQRPFDFLTMRNHYTTRTVAGIIGEGRGARKSERRKEGSGAFFLPHPDYAWVGGKGGEGS